MDISMFGEAKNHISTKLVEMGVKYVYKYYPAKDEFKKSPTEENELLEFAYEKMVDLLEILTKDDTQIQKIRAYKQEIENVHKYVDCDLMEVYADLEHMKGLLIGGD